MYKERAMLLVLMVFTALPGFYCEEAPVEINEENEIVTEEPKENVKTATKTVFSNNLKESDNKIHRDLPSARAVLDASNFKETISEGYTFVKFYAPWCGHCSEMAPDWNDLANHFFEHPINGKDLIIAEVDCTESGMTCINEGVNGYPTLKLYKDGFLLEDFYFARTLDRMKRYLGEKLINIDALETNSIGGYTLNDLTFTKFIENSGAVPVVVKFYVPWCTHCQELQEVYDELVIKFLMEEAEDVKFAEVNCMDMDSLDTCTDEGVEGFPAVHMYKDGIIEDVFDEDRTIEKLSNFVWQTVDPTRVEDDDGLDFLSLAGMMGMGGGQEEFEECDCSEPDCDCEEELETEDDNLDEFEEVDCDCSDPECDCEEYEEEEYEEEEYEDDESEEDLIADTNEEKNESSKDEVETSKTGNIDESEQIDNIEKSETIKETEPTEPTEPTESTKQKEATKPTETAEDKKITDDDMKAYSDRKLKEKESEPKKDEL